MSASLVGSEMCIRDSRALHMVRAARRMHLRAWLAKPRVDSTIASQQGDCLLYTSDAADDM
eukprot:3769066-Alexandrium_andersonii.AAC.1